MPRPRVSPYLAVWTVISLRPAAQQAALKRAIAARGATPLALPALRLAPAEDERAATRALRTALACAVLVFTSPEAVRHAARLVPLKTRRAQRVVALGAGTARALARHGIIARHPPPGAARSEGVLALPELAALAPGAGVGLVTAPGGRDALAPALRARGLAVRRADVYRRLPARLDRRHAQALRASRAPRALLLSSAEALDHALARLPPDAAALLRGACVVAASVRLAAHARRHGCEHVVSAADASPQALLDALEAYLQGHAG